MRSSTPLFFVVAVLAFSCTSEPAKWTPRPVLENVPDRVVDLRISWRTGDEFRWTVEERYSNVSGRLHGDASRLVVLEARIRVVELAGDGSALLEQHIDRVRYEENQAAGRRYFDSNETEGNPENAPIVLQRSLDLAGKTVRFRVSLSGSPRDFSFPEEFQRNDHIAKVAALPRLFTSDGWRQSVEVLAMLPLGPARAGDVWNHVTRGSYAFGILHTQSDLSYRGRVESQRGKGDLMHRIDFTKTLGLVKGSKPEGPIFFEGGEASGEIYVSQGEAASLEFRQKGRLGLRYETRRGVASREMKSSITIRLDQIDANDVP